MSILFDYLINDFKRYRSHLMFALKTKAYLFKIIKRDKKCFRIKIPLQKLIALFNRFWKLMLKNLETKFMTKIDRYLMKKITQPTQFNQVHQYVKIIMILKI